MPISLYISLPLINLHILLVLPMWIQPYAALAQRLHLSTKCSSRGSAVGSRFPTFRAPLAQSARSAERNGQTLLHLPTLKGPVGPKTGRILGLRRAPGAQTCYTAVHIYFVMFCLCNFPMDLHTSLATFKMLLNLP